MGLKEKWAELKERKEQEDEFKKEYRKAYNEEKMKKLPELAKARVEEEMKARLEKNKSGSKIEGVRKVMEGANRFAEGFVGVGIESESERKIRERRMKEWFA